MKEAFRKWIVGLKRRPQNICTFLLAISCMIYTFNLTAHSNAAMYVSSNAVALYVFGVTLCSMLTIFSHINVYAPRQKRKLLMQIIVYVLVLGQLALDGLYYMEMLRQISGPNPVPKTPDIIASVNGTLFHMIALGVTLLALIFKPVYAKLLNKIDTTVPDPELDNLQNTDESLIEEDFEEFII